MTPYEEYEERSNRMFRFGMISISTFILILAIILSCSKNVEKAVELIPTNKTAAVTTLIKNLDSSTLKVNLEPVLTCYSYSPGEPIIRYCDIFIYATVEFSKPINRWVQIELVGEYGSFLIIPPRVSKVKLNTGIFNQNNIYITGSYRMKISTWIEKE